MNSDSCPVKITLSLISNKWKVLIIYELLSGAKRYGQIGKALPMITKKVLTDNLRSLEHCGLIHRKIYYENILRVEYSLTDLGKSLNPILIAMYNWGNDYIKVNEQIHKTESKNCN